MLLAGAASGVGVVIEAPANSDGLYPANGSEGVIEAPANSDGL